MEASTATRSSHHHGNLRDALVEAGIEILEAGETFSLRSAARRVGVSQAAPYRHFADKSNLETAMAARGFVELNRHLSSALTEAGSPDDPLITRLVIAYVDFAVQHPALYRLMHERAVTPEGARMAESAEAFALLERIVATEHPDVDANALATAGWALAHGFASLHLDGHIAIAPETSVDDRIRSALQAALSLGQLD